MAAPPPGGHYCREVPTSFGPYLRRLTFASSTRHSCQSLDSVLHGSWASRSASSLLKEVPPSTRGGWPFILEYLLKCEASRGLRGMSPLGSNQNNLLDDAVHSDIDTQFKSRLLDAVGQALIATDRQRRVIYWNQAAERLYGWSAEEVMGYPIVETTRSVEPTERTEEIMAALEDGRIWTGECVVRRKNGTSFTAMVTETAVHDEEGALVAVIGISTDISELKMPGELSRSEERFRALAQHASD